MRYTRRIGDATVTYGDGICLTEFDDDTAVLATPNYDSESLARARSLGYRTPVAMTEQHDLMHSLIAEARGLPHSDVLWALAHGEPSPPTAAEEEALAMFVQRIAQRGGLASVLAEHVL